MILHGQIHNDCTWGHIVIISSAAERLRTLYEVENLSLSHSPLVINRVQVKPFHGSDLSQVIPTLPLGNASLRQSPDVWSYSSKLSSEYLRWDMKGLHETHINLSHDNILYDCEQTCSANLWFTTVGGRRLHTYSNRSSAPRVQQQADAGTSAHHIICLVNETVSRNFINLKNQSDSPYCLILNADTRSKHQ